MVFQEEPAGSFRRTAFWWTVGLLTPAGFLLDIVFGTLFFSFPNAGATLQVFLPGFSFVTGGFVFDLPIEEFVFYSSGFVAILLVVHLVQRGVGAGVRGGRLRRHLAASDVPYPAALALGGVRGCRAGGGRRVQEVVCVAHRGTRKAFRCTSLSCWSRRSLPSLLLYRCARPFINWRAFSVTLLWVLLTSLLWEATLASPFGWWHYHHKWMMGMHIRAWADLPVEAAILWIAVTYTTTIVYETIKLAFTSDIGLLEPVQLHVRLTDDLAARVATLHVPSQ